ncbi:hypothetical protein TWF718_005186 [Orbilia javanica]|uniref:Uncharacterized protein n=1 Tax=Orbilia javanica TaxID=47235 RepID=A0AAN8MYL9_9PEZI
MGPTDQGAKASYSTLISRFDPSFLEEEFKGSKVGNPNIDAGDILLRLPNLFPISFPALRGTNKYYTEESRLKKVDWVSEIIGFDEKSKKDLADLKLALLCAYWAPDASEDRFWILNIFQDWIFIFDDQFDEGHLSNDAVAATRDVLDTLAIFEENHPHITAEQDPLKHMFQIVWNAIKSVRQMEL